MSLFVDVITGGSNSHQTTSEAANYFATDFVAAGVVGAVGNTGGVGPCTGGLGVSAQASPNNTVQINTGAIYVQATPTGQGSQMLRVRNTTTINQTISANVSGSTKYDWVYVQIDPTNANNPDAPADNVASIYVSRSSSNTADNGTPPAFGTLIAVITVANGFSTITNGNISDRRAQTSLSTNSAITTGWNAVNATLSYNANNGAKEFVLNTSVDLTGVLSPGMRFKVGRGVTAPTQCMAFSSASTQYATKVSPANITFTGPFTVEAWVYPLTYSGSSPALLFGRRDSSGTGGGWDLSLTASGQPMITYGSASSFTQIQSNFMIALNRWTHVAGVVTSVSGKTGAIYINGTSVPINNPLSAATTLTQQAVDLRMGSYAGTPGALFNGYLSEVRLWSTNQSSSSILSNMGISLTGTETNLLALYSGNGNFNDATSNANNLTATNGAIATQANNPYHSTEYGVITNVTSTTITVFAGTDYVMPNMALLSPNYAINRAPYGFPAGRSKWVVDWYSPVDAVTASPVQNTWYNYFGFQIPVGSWVARYWMNLNSSAVANGSVQATISNANNSESDMRLTAEWNTTTATAGRMPLAKEGRFDLTAQTTYYFNYRTRQSGNSNIGPTASIDPAYVILESGYF